MAFSYNDDEQTIMGTHISDSTMYRALRDAFQYNVYAGWKPTQDDLARAIERYNHPTDEMKATFKKTWGIDL